MLPGKFELRLPDRVGSKPCENDQGNDINPEKRAKYFPKKPAPSQVLFLEAISHTANSFD